MAILRIRDADGTIHEITALRGEKGEKGADGTMSFEDLTDAQKASLKGDPGQPGKDGSNGKDGKDGISVTHSWNGTVLTITSASGTSSADLKGDPGEPGQGGGGIFTEDTEYPGCFYRMVDGEKEWLNPPMVYGMAYPTVERHNGKRVWVGINDYGKVSNLFYGYGISFQNLIGGEYSYPDEFFYSNCNVVYAYPYFSWGGYDYHPYQYPLDIDYGYGLINDAGSHMQINFDPDRYKGTPFEDYNFYCLFKFTNYMDEEGS